MRKQIVNFIVTVVAVVGFDQITKELALKLIPSGGTVRVFGDFFRFTLARNPGGVFGTRIGGNLVYIIFSLIGIALIFMYFKQFFHSKSRIGILSVGLLLGGALGNLIDRIRFAMVTDFLDFGIGNLRWATFNIADAAILIGIIALFIIEWKNVKKNRDTCSEGHSEDEDRPLPCPGSDTAVEVEDSISDSSEADKGDREGN